MSYDNQLNVTNVFTGKGTVDSMIPWREAATLMVNMSNSAVKNISDNHISKPLIVNQSVDDNGKIAHIDAFA